MNGYIEVSFGESNKLYVYMIPDHIQVKDIQNWVVVENVFYSKEKCPYKVVKVVNVYDETWKCNRKDLKYIVVAIDGLQYKKDRTIEREKQKIEKEFSLELQKCIDCLSLEYKVKWLLALTGNENMHNKIAKLYKHYEDILGEE